MRFYKAKSKYCCGIDLHSNQMYVCVMDREGDKLLHMNIRGNDFEFFLKKIAPWREDMTVVCECLFNWYWLADACQEAGLTFVLAHALYLHAIHGGKNKNDRIDSEKLAHLLRCNMIPYSYVYPAKNRPMRALLRQRMSYVWQRAEFLQRICTRQMAEALPVISAQKQNRDKWMAALLDLHENQQHRFALKSDMFMIKHYDLAIKDLEKELIKLAQTHAPRDYNLLRTVPGIGETLALTILYEVEDISRFATVGRFLSYSRLVKGTVASSGKIKGLRGAKLGNAYLRWAFGQAAILGKRHDPRLAALADALHSKHNKFKANTIMANKIGRAVYFMLKNKTAFDVEALTASVATV